MSLNYLAFCGVALATIGGVLIALASLNFEKNRKFFKWGTFIGALLISLGFAFQAPYYNVVGLKDCIIAIIVVIAIILLLYFACGWFRSHRVGNGHQESVPNRKRHFILILYEQFKKQSEASGIIFFMFGFILLVLSAVLVSSPTAQEVASRVVFPAALATISLGIGFIAVGVTVESDKRYSELLGRILHQVEDLPYKLGDKVRLPSVLGDYSKEAAQKRLDEDTKNNRGQPRGELFEVEKGKWAIYWGGKYPL